MKYRSIRTPKRWAGAGIILAALISTGGVARAASPPSTVSGSAAHAGMVVIASSSSVTTDHGFPCTTGFLSYDGKYYDTNTTTPIYPGDIIVPGVSYSRTTSTKRLLVCTFHTRERPASDQYQSGTTNCYTGPNNTYPSYFFTQTENTGGLVTLRCYANA
ncbi:MAG: hypothetical protein ACR2GA_01090 [Chloroflexota bacterium]